MKKKILNMLSLLLCLWLCISLAACRKSKHEAKSEWKYDEKVHWHECATKGHDDRIDVADHNFDGGEVTAEPTETEAGTKTFTCVDCGYKKTESIGKLSHTHTFDTTKWESNESAHWHKATCEHTDEKGDFADHRWNDGVITKQATDTEEGEKTFTCNDCKRTKTESIGTLSHKHTFDETKWESDETHHWHKATCEHTSEKEGYAAHTFDGGKVTAEPTEATEGEKTYTCGICGYKKTEKIAKLDHKHTFDETTWEGDETHHWRVANCGHDVRKDEAEHRFNAGVITVNPTEKTDGKKVYTCGDCGYKKTEVLARLDHKHTFDETKWTTSETKHWHASSCGHDVRKDEANHSFDAGVVTKAATEEAEGEKTYTCGVCGCKKTEKIAKLDHTHKFDETKWATSETKHWHASSCGHDVRKDEAEHKFTDWTVETPASVGVEGREKRTCNICGYVAKRAIPALTAKENSITVGAISFTYNAKSQPIDSFVTAGNKAGMVIKYVGVDGTTYEESTAAPKNAGTYQYTITIPATAEWKAAEKTGKYTIEKYELTEVYGTTHTKEYSGTLGISVKVNPFGGEEVSVNIAMKKADAGTKEIGRAWVVGVTNSNNYTIDQSKIKAEITPKILSGFSFAVAKSELIGTSGTQVITLTVPNTQGKVSVNIRFDIATLTHEGTLTLITGTPGQGEAEIEFSIEEGDEYKNYEFASSGIGTLTLTTFVIGG